MKIKIWFTFGSCLILWDVEFVRMEDKIVSIYFWNGAKVPKWIAIHEPEETTCRENGYVVADFESVERIERVL